MIARHDRTTRFTAEPTAAPGAAAAAADGLDPAGVLDGPEDSPAGPASGSGRGSRVLSRVRGAGAQRGMTTAEYAVGTAAACGFGGVLYKVLTSPQILEVVKQVILKAIGSIF